MEIGISERPVVLLVEDDPDWISVLRWSLEPACEVIVARSATQALAALETHRVEVIATHDLIDGLSSVALLRQVRELGERAPAVVLTRQPHDPRLAEALSDGVVAGVIEMPVKREELQDAVTLMRALAVQQLRN